MIIGTLNGDAPHAHVAHLGEGDFLFAGHLLRPSPKRGPPACRLSRDQLPKAVYFRSGFFQLIGGLIQQASVKISGRIACQTRIVLDLLCPSSKPLGDTAHLLDVNHLLLLPGCIFF